MSVRLCQVVLVARHLDATVARLRSELGLGEPYADPGVALFGLRNAVFSLLADGVATYVEVVSPAADDAPAARHLKRLGGDGGYMVMFETDDLAAVRTRAKETAVRVAWEIDLDDIAGTHFHPADLGGTIVSVDQPDPPGSWRWAGPGREERASAGAVVGATIAVADPGSTAARWAGVLGEPAPGIAFTAGDRGLVEVELAGALDASVEIAGVRFSPSRG